MSKGGMHRKVANGCVELDFWEVAVTWGDDCGAGAQASTCRYSRHSWSVSFRVTLRKATSMRSSRRMFQTRRTPSSLALASVRPSGEKAIESDLSGVSAKDELSGAGCRIPESNGSIVACRRELRSVSVETQVADFANVASEDDLTASTTVPGSRDARP